MIPVNSLKHDCLFDWSEKENLLAVGQTVDLVEVVLGNFRHVSKED